MSEEGADRLARPGLLVAGGDDEGPIALSYQVLATAPIGMALTDADGTFHWVNEALCELSGTSAEELLGHHRDEVLPDRGADALAAVLDGTVDRVERELRWRRPDGEERWVSLHASLATGPDDAPLHLGPKRLPALVLQVIDITDRREAEEVTAALRDELARRNADLERSNAELEEFAYVASHDLSEPLRVISGHVQLLASRYADDLDDDARVWIDYAVDGCKRMRSLIEDLLLYSRAGRDERPFELVDLGAVAERARRDLEVTIAEAGADVEIAALPTVLGDERQLGQLLANLLANAVKFRRDEGEALVRVSATHADDEWRIEVADNGIGVAERHRERVFRLFQRLHLRDAYPGTGLGLSICRKIVARHGGRIWVDDGIDGGAALCFTLPASPAADDRRAAGAAS